jgi:hypothetical protein
MEKPSFEDYMMDDDKTLSDYLHDFMTYLAAQGNDKAAKFDMSRLSHLTATGAGNMQEWLDEHGNGELMQELMTEFPEIMESVLEEQQDDFTKELQVLTRLRHRSMIDSFNSRVMLGAALRDAPTSRALMQSKVERSLQVAIYQAMQNDEPRLLDAFIQHTRESLLKMDEEFGDNLPRHVQMLKAYVRSASTLRKILELSQEDFVKLHNALIDQLCEDLSEEPDDEHPGIHVLYRHYLTVDDEVPAVPGLAVTFLDLKRGAVIPMGLVYHDLLQSDFDDEFNHLLHENSYKELVMNQTMEYLNQHRESVIEHFKAQRLTSNEDGELWAGHVSVEPMSQVPSASLLNRKLRELSRNNSVDISENDIDSFIADVLKIEEEDSNDNG